MHSELEYSGAPFGRPNPTILTKAWRIKNSFLAPRDLAPVPAHKDELEALVFPEATAVLQGQDGITASNLTLGLPVYGGYYNGTYANLTSIRSRVGTGPVVLSITPNGMNGARCIDVEPGDATPAACPGFFHNALHGGGQKDAGKPMIYTSAGDLQAVINAMNAAGIPRSSYLLWSAHWIGNHICGPATCGYPQADGTQYASNNKYDSDAFYSYCFIAPADPTFPLVVGDADVTANGPVRTLQKNLNTWATPIGLKTPLVPDGNYGPATKAAVGLAQVHFGERGVAGGVCTLNVYNDLAKPVPPPPPKPPIKPPPPPKPPTPKPSPPHTAPVGLKSSTPLVVSWTAVGGSTKYTYTLTEPTGKVYRTGTVLIPSATFEDLVSAGGHGKWVFKVQATNDVGSGPAAELSFIL